MFDAESARQELATLPLAAPCRRLPTFASFEWLRRGWLDIREAPVASLTVGLLLSTLNFLVVFASWKFGLLALYMGLASGFVLIGPFLAVGLYSISYQLEVGRRATLRSSLREGAGHLRDTLVVGICLLIVLLVWARAATVMSVFRPVSATPELRELIPFFGIGSVVGAGFAAVVFAATAFSLPMLLDRRVDAVTAVVTSINATLRNKRAMLVWGALIVAAVIVGYATMLIGFVVLLPLIGHATWHGYRKTIDASAWPASHVSDSEAAGSSFDRPRHSSTVIASPARAPERIAIAVSARHAHLSQPTLEKLFGEGFELTPRTALSQTGQYAAVQTVMLRGPRGQLEHVRVMGPPRAQDQIEISRSDEFVLGIDAPVRISGDLENTPGIVLVGSHGQVNLNDGVITALRHIHMGNADAARIGVRDREVVSVRIHSAGRALTFDDVTVRVAPDFRLELHLDTDEANAAGVTAGAWAELVWPPSA